MRRARPSLPFRGMGGACGPVGGGRSRWCAVRPVLRVLRCGGGAASEVGQEVLHRRRAAGVHGAGDQSTGFEVAEGLREHLVAVAVAAGPPAQLGPALRAVDEVDQDQGGPPGGDQVEQLPAGAGGISDVASHAFPQALTSPHLKPCTSRQKAARSESPLIDGARRPHRADPPGRLDAADRPDLRRRRHRVPGRPGPTAQDRRPGVDARATALSRRRPDQPHPAPGQPRHHRTYGGLRCPERAHHRRRCFQAEVKRDLKRVAGRTWRSVSTSG